MVVIQLRGGQITLQLATTHTHRRTFILKGSYTRPPIVAPRAPRTARASPRVRCMCWDAQGRGWQPGRTYIVHTTPRVVYVAPLCAYIVYKSRPRPRPTAQQAGRWTRAPARRARRALGELPPRASAQRVGAAAQQHKPKPTDLCPIS